MGGSSQPNYLVSLPLSKDLLQGTEEPRNSSSSGYLWSKAKKQKKGTKKSVIKSRRPRRVLMKKRVGSRRQGNYGIQRRVRTLKRLLPNSDSMGLDGLFREAADYILSLQTRVRVMQVMVKVLTGSDE